MMVKVKLFDIFRDFLPRGTQAENFRLVLDEDARILDIFSMLKISKELPNVIMCNGGFAGEDQLLKDGDVVAVFSPIFGG